jgi:hypothetical protein
MPTASSHAIMRQNRTSKPGLNVYTSTTRQMDNQQMDNQQMDNQRVGCQNSAVGGVLRF